MLLLSIGALVLPALDTISNEAGAASEGFRLRNTLERARMEAIDRGRPMLVRLESGDRLRVRPWIGEEDAPSVIDVPLKGVELPDQVLPIVLAMILPDGQARMAAPLVMQDEEGRRSAFMMDPLTGMVRSVKPPPSDDGAERQLPVVEAP